MKVEIILAIVWMTLCGCERQQRSTVLTDESKRVLEHFDFSNFDKQEALNYIDRQRYENQIRGKRSHAKSKRNRDGKSEKILDTDTERNESPNQKEWCREVKSRSNSERNEKNRIDKGALNNVLRLGSPVEDDAGVSAQTAAAPFRNKRGHRFKKKKGKGKCDTKKKWRKKKNKKKRKRRYWGHWNEWSPCSVTCGRGRKIRWRKCVVKKCDTGEIEMGEKTCQLPACNLLTKLLKL